MYSGLFKKIERVSKDPYKDFDPFKPKEDPYKKLVAEQERNRNFKVKISNISFLLGLFLAIFNFSASFLKIEALNNGLIIFTFPTSFLLILLTIYFGINLIGEKREFSIGLKLIFLPLIMNLFLFYSMDVIRLSENTSFIHTILLVSSSILLLLLVLIGKEKVQIKLAGIISIIFLFLSFFLIVLAFLKPIIGG